MPEKTEHLQSEKWCFRGFLTPFSFFKAFNLNNHHHQINNASDIKFLDIKDLDLSSKHFENNNQETTYYQSLLKNGTLHYVENIEAKFKLLKVGDFTFPILITSDNYENSYVCSPFGNYVLLGIESLQEIKNRFLKKLGRFGINIFGKILKASSINSAIYINHSLLSTDLQPNDLHKNHIKTIVSFLKKKYPQHAIIFRSINSYTCPEIKQNLKLCDFHFIASRQIYLTDVSDLNLLQTRIIKSDLKLWKEKTYEVVEGNDLTYDDELRILNLYKMNAIEHHSSLNPQINIHFVQLLKKNSIFQFKALRKNGLIEGVVGYYIKDKIFHCALIGYDRQNASSNQIYRLLSIMLLLEASKTANTFHQSAGASIFKKIRRAKSFQEYQAIYTKHLNWKQKFSWTFIKLILNIFAIRFMKKY